MRIIFRYVHGLRVVLPPLDQDSALIRLIDFNVHPKRVNEPRAGLPTCVGDHDYEVVTSKSTIKAGKFFKVDVETTLPYAITRRRDRFAKYKGFMIDEEQIIAMQVRVICQLTSRAQPTSLQDPTDYIDVYAF